MQSPPIPILSSEFPCLLIFTHLAPYAFCSEVRSLLSFSPIVKVPFRVVSSLFLLSFPFFFLLVWGAFFLHLLFLFFGANFPPGCLLAWCRILFWGYGSALVLEYKLLFEHQTQYPSVPTFSPGLEPLKHWKWSPPFFSVADALVFDCSFRFCLRIPHINPLRLWSRLPPHL